MTKVSFNEERKLWKQEYRYVVGLDESGRGPLAGPVTAAAVMVRPEHSVLLSARRSPKIFLKNFGLRDSKKLSKKQRKYFYDVLTNHKDIRWGIGVVSEKVIDKINILEATKLAMQKSLDNLYQKVRSSVLFDRGWFLLLDGNFRIKSKIPQKSVIRGDEKVFSCSAAGIIAKVTRDRIMEEMHKKYPQYGFDRHKGYGTKLHIEKLQNFGPCKIHRKTFFPVSALVKRENV